MLRFCFLFKKSGKFIFFTVISLHCKAGTVIVAANASLPRCYIFHCESFFVFDEINSNFLNKSFVAGLLVALMLWNVL